LPKLIKDPVHGYVTVEDELLGVLDSYALQRLRRIQQLPLSHYVYPTARHSRFDHSLGCMSLAEEYARHLGLDGAEGRLLKLGALLHDVGHTPYSHLLEVILIEKGKSHEEMGLRIIREDEELASAIEESGTSTRELIDLLSGRHRLSSIVSGPLDVDRLDFLLRDSYFTGATYGVVDARRIIRLTRLDSRGLYFESRALGAVEELAIARHHSFLNIYFHHAVRAAQLLFLRGFTVLKDEGLDFAEMSVPEYLSHDDITVWARLKSDPRTRPVIEELERRRLPKMVMEVQLSGDVEIPTRMEECRALEDEIASRLGVPAEWVYFDSTSLPPLIGYAAQPIRIEPAESELRPSSWILEMTSRPLRVVRVYVRRGSVDIESARSVVRRIFEDRGWIARR
jgi:putative nucleotidyltransferase with HDIG domain